MTQRVGLVVVARNAAPHHMVRGGYRARWGRRWLLGCLFAAAACSSKPEPKGNGSPPQPALPKPTFTLIALAEVRGQVGPCGCTTDPLGDIARTAKVISDARNQGPVLVVDAGSLLYAKSPIPAHLVSQEERKADLLTTIYKELDVAAVGLGPADLPAGAKGVRFPRAAVNVPSTEGFPIEPPELIEIGGSKVGVFGVATTDALPGVKVAAPVPAAKQAATELEARGAQVIVGLVQAANRKDAVTLVRGMEGAGVDIAIAGLGLAAPEPDHVELEAQNIGGTWLVIPANRGQVISRLDVTVRGAGPLVDAIGPKAAAAKTASLDSRIAAIDADLAKFAADPTADPTFVKQKRAERTELAAERTQLANHPTKIPAAGNYFTLEQVRINKTLGCSAPIQDAVSKYYLATGEANLKAAAGTPPPPLAKGKPGYVGMAACDDCHSDAVEFWNKTVHARAWKTLVDRGQQFDLDCIGCHVTGWQQPGGSNLAHNETLRDVQCEVCHGPGSIHVQKGGDEKPAAVTRVPREDLCATLCHTKEHSDTFDHQAYMRDILGPGHGADARAKLGDGPTGAQLRKAGLDKAGRPGPGCVR
ncbi:MAG: multiheme c-type cytochrome [Kofleriaceae bacterium]